MRCIHLHHIRHYQGFYQKMMYVIRRLLGIATPCADLTGCKHVGFAGAWALTGLYDYALPDAETAPKLFDPNFKHGCVTYLDGVSEHPDTSGVLLFHDVDRDMDKDAERVLQSIKDMHGYGITFMEIDEVPQEVFGPQEETLEGYIKRRLEEEIEAEWKIHQDHLINGPIPEDCDVCNLRRPNGDNQVQGGNLSDGDSGPRVGEDQI